MNIKNSRNHYLHLWDGETEDERGVALFVFGKAFQLFKEVTGVGLSEEAGTIKINPLLMKLFDTTKAKEV